MNPDIESSSILPQTTTQKLEVLAEKQANHLALLKIHGQFPLSFQKLFGRIPAYTRPLFFF